MDVKVTTKHLTRSIADGEIRALLSELLESFHEQATALIKGFADDGPTPQKANDLENQLFDDLRELGRQLIQWVFSHLEPAVEDMPGTVTCGQKSIVDRRQVAALGYRYPVRQDIVAAWAIDEAAADGPSSLEMLLGSKTASRWQRLASANSSPLAEAPKAGRWR